MMDKPIKFEVKGEPSTWGTKKQWKWREKIKNEIEKKTEVEKDIRFKVTINFKVNDTKKDLDNLAKPVLDTLFKIRNPQSEAKNRKLYGALFDVDDDRVCELILKKEIPKDGENEGAEIKIEEIKNG